MKPTVGRIVHFYWNNPQTDADTEPHAAIIVRVYKLDGRETVNLNVLLNEEEHNSYDGEVRLSRFVDDVPFSPEPEPGYWTWPPRVSP